MPQVHLPLLSTLVDCDPQYDKIFALLLGDVALTDNLDHALEESVKYPNLRYATQNGELVNAQSIIMGGGKPDSLVMKVLSIFPLTSPAILSVRLVLTNVPFYETLSAISLLLLSIWFLRKVAGKIFALAILMYGKEPSWREMTRWARET